MTRIIQAFVFSLSLFTSCDKGSEPVDYINPKIKRIKWCCSDFAGGDFRMGVWYGDKLFCVAPGRLLDMNLEFDVIKDTLLLWPGPFLFISKNVDGSKFLIVKSVYTDVTIGQLMELDIQTTQLRTLKDSTHNISSALYLSNSQKCVYYTYGNANKGIQAGYYLLDTITGSDSLVLPYLSDLGSEAPMEVVNGFDIRPDGRKMLIPLNRSTQTPKFAEYDLVTKQMDTLNVDFARQFLWVRYNSSAKQILYCNYPRGVGGNSVNDDTEIGIIDTNTLSKRVLDVNTNLGGLSVSVFPNWSPDNKHIVYGSTKGPAQEPPGAKGAYSIYILRDVN